MSAMSFLDRLIDTFASNFARTTLAKTDVLPITMDIRQISISGSNTSVYWRPLEEGDEPRLVLEKEVAGNSDEALQSCLEQIRLEHHTSGTRQMFNVVMPSPRSSGVHNVSTRLTLYAAPEQVEDFQVQTSNGLIEVTCEFNCNLDLRSRNGRITVQSGSGTLRLSTSNGRIELGRVRLTGPSKFTTSNGMITGHLAGLELGEHVFETSNGRVNLRVPSNTTGSFSLTTSNGSIDFRLGNETMSGRNISFNNGPGPSLHVRTSNGSISVTDS